MFKNKLSLLLFIILFLKGFFSHGQIPLDKNASLSILTCEKGNELYSLFGHTAIRIKDMANDLDVVYNYGTFDFATENFYLKFIKGDLQYFATANPFNEFFYEYTLQNRSIYEQKLNLTYEQKQQLFNALNKSLLSNEKYYTYKFIDKNCTNMVADKINQTLQHDYIVKVSEQGMTYREILFPYIENHFYENLGINIIFGKKVDESGNRLFLPNQLLESLKVAKLNGKRIAEDPKTILKATPEAPKKSLWNNYYSFCLIFVLVILSRKLWIYLSYFVLIGLLGIFLTLVGFYSFHEEVANNYTVLLFNPLALLLVVCFWRKKFIWVKKITLFCLALLGIFSIILFNKPNLLLFLPMIICSGILLYFFYKRSKQELLSTIK